jgi:RNase P subunit RPR2
MSDPISYMALTFPAPICDRCAQPMLTVTTVHRRTNSEPLHVVSYYCQKCRCTLGNQSHKRSKLASVFTPPENRPA